MSGKDTITERLAQIVPACMDGELWYEAQRVYQAFRLDPRKAAREIRKEYKRREFRYGAFRVAVMDLGITPNNADPDVQYADDIEFDVIQPDPEVTVALEMTQLPLDIRAGIEGAKLDNKGVMVQSANDTPPYYAIGAKAELRAGGFRYIWLLKCRATPMTEQYHTKEGATITRQTGQVEFTAIKRTSDGHWKYTADEGQNGFDATAAASFLSSVYTPTFTSGGSEES